MRKQQVLALLLTGALTVGMAPAAVVSAEDASALTIEDGQAAVFEGSEAAPEETTPDVTADEPAAEPDTPAADPTDTPAEPPVTDPADTPVTDPTDTPAADPADTPAADPTDTPAADPTQVPVDVPVQEPEGNLLGQAEDENNKEEKVTKQFTLGEKEFDSLEEAIAASSASMEEEGDIILIHSDLEIGSTVIIPSDKNVIIAAATDKDINITRKPGFTGDLFKVNGGMLQFGGVEGVDDEGIEKHGTLTINGKGDGNVSSGSIVSVAEDGSFGLCAYCNMTGNTTSANGGAVNCTSGIVMVSGGSITGNSTSGEGGAIYSESVVYVGGDINISGNTGAAGAASNIVLKNDPAETDPDLAVAVNVYDKLNAVSPIGIKLSDPAVGTPAVIVDSDIEGITPAEVLAQFTYEDEKFTLDENGALKSTEEPPVDVKLELTLKGQEWASTNRVQINGVSTKDGDAYIKVVKKGSKALTADQIIAANQKLKGGVTANTEFTFAHTFSAEEKKEVGSDAVTVYICVKDADGNTAVSSVNMNAEARPPKVSGVSSGTGWTGHNSANVVCISDKAGSYYWGWSVRSGESTSASSKAPEIDFSKEGVPVAANTNFTVYANDLDSDSPIDIYIYVKGEDGSISAPLVAKMNEANRPPVASPTPTRQPINPLVSESKVTGLENPLEFYPNTFYEFTVIGAGTQNNDPIEGDTRWVPLYWSMSSNPADKDKHSSWKIGAAGGIRKADTYNLYIFFRQDRYNGREWQPTDSIVSQVYQFRSAEIEYSLSPTPTVIPGTYGYDQYGNPVDENGNPIVRDGDDDDTGSTTAAGANTADESPVGTMSMLAVLSLLAGGYVITRKRKKVTE